MTVAEYLKKWHHLDKPIKKWYGYLIIDSANSMVCSFEGCPEEIYGDFKLTGLGMKSLKGFPKIITGDFITNADPSDVWTVWTEDVRKACKVGGEINIYPVIHGSKIAENGRVSQ